MQDHLASAALFAGSGRWQHHALDGQQALIDLPEGDFDGAQPGVESGVIFAHVFAQAAYQRHHDGDDRDGRPDYRSDDGNPNPDNPTGVIAHGRTVSRSPALAKVPPGAAADATGNVRLRSSASGFWLLLQESDGAPFAPVFAGVGDVSASRSPTPYPTLGRGFWLKRVSVSLWNLRLWRPTTSTGSIMVPPPSVLPARGCRAGCGEATGRQTLRSGMADRKKVPIAKIDLHTQVRARVDRAVVQRYAELIKEGTEFPPVDLFRDGERTRFDLADGYHRLRAYEKLRRATIPARVHAGTRDEAWWFALGANRTHGLRLGAGDVRRAVQMAVKRRPDASQRVIAAHVGCSHRYVGMVRNELEERLAEEAETAERHSQVGSGSHLAERTVGADGKSYRARRPAKPKPPPPAKPTDTPASSASQPAAPLDSGPVTSVAATEPSVPVAVTPDRDPWSPAGPALPLLSPSPSTESGEVSPPPPAVALDCNVIVSEVAKAADTVVAQHDAAQLIVPEDVDRARLPAWVDSLRAGRREFDAVLQVLEPLLEGK